MKFQLHFFFKIALIFACCCPVHIVLAQTSHQIWDKTLGGNSGDHLYSIINTADGGYMLAGYSYSGMSGDKSGANQGNADYWIVKLDINGNKLWDKTFGGSGDDSFTSVLQTTDGGYILGGFSNSDISGDKTQASQGSYDYWVIKIDGSGNKIWDKTLGGNSRDLFASQVQCPDGGFILAGYSESTLSGNKTQANMGASDYWIVKLDGNGNQLWDKTIGGSDGDEGFLVISATSDGGYILGGASESQISGDKTEASQGGYDYWIVKLTDNGQILWDKTIGGSGGDDLRSILQTADGGYILAGSSDSGVSGDKSEVNQGIIDYWVVKLDENGNKIWDKTIGGNDIDLLYSMIQTPDGGYMLGGTSVSGTSGEKTAASKGGYDYWLVKLNANGAKLWDKGIGGNNSDELFGIIRAADGDYVLGGRSASDISGDKTQATHGGTDYWTIKIQLLDPGQILPVTWLYFKGKATGNGNQLNWATATEKNTECFFIERSDNGAEFRQIARVNAKGNSNQQATYTYLDRNFSFSGPKTSYYRLKQLDLDGKFTYTEPVSITNEKVEIAIFPNPFISIIQVKLPQIATVNFRLSNAEGKVIYAKDKDASTGIVQLNDLPEINPGVYVLQVTYGTHTTITKVIKY